MLGQRPELVCQQIVELVTDYLEGALSRSERRRFEPHLAGTGATGAAGTGVVGGGIAGTIGAKSFNMSLYGQATATPMIQAGTLSHFTVHFTASVSKHTVLVVEKNGAATTITCTVAEKTNSCSDSTDMVAFAASDTILVHASYSGANSGTDPSWSATYP